MLVSYDLLFFFSSNFNKNCRVTRMLVSYDCRRKILTFRRIIAGSPECWWVTTERSTTTEDQLSIAGSPECWWVTTDRQSSLLPQGGLQGHQNVGELRQLFAFFYFSFMQLQGHQNVGELRHPSLNQWQYLLNCRVTRMLVSYDMAPKINGRSALIARSPECWWVTTNTL